MSIVMRATLHDPAPNTYYGQWPGRKAAVCGPRTPAIAHHERVASARFGAFAAQERDFPGNRSPTCWKYVSQPKRKSARQATRRWGRLSTGEGSAPFERALGERGVDLLLEQREIGAR